MFLTIENYLFTAAMAVYLGGTALFFLFAGTKKECHARIAGLLITVGFVFHTLALVVRASMCFRTRFPGSLSPSLPKV